MVFLDDNITSVKRLAEPLTCRPAQLFPKAEQSVMRARPGTGWLAGRGVAGVPSAIRAAVSVSVSPGPVSPVVSPRQCQGWLRLSRVSPPSYCHDEDRTSEDNFLPSLPTRCGRVAQCGCCVGGGLLGTGQLMQRRAPPALLVLTPDRIPARQGETSRPATSQQDQNRF